jgi:hypothetical protein
MLHPIRLDSSRYQRTIARNLQFTSPRQFKAPLQKLKICDSELYSLIVSQRIGVYEGESKDQSRTSGRHPGTLVRLGFPQRMS